MKALDIRLKLCIGLLGTALFFFFLTRVGLWMIYYPHFKSLTALQTIQALFLRGPIIDLSTIATFLGAGFLMTQLPVLKKGWLRFWSSLIVLGLFLMTLILITDLIYFDYVSRHIGTELRTITNDLNYILDFAFSHYWIYFILIGLTIALSLWGVGYLISRASLPTRLSLRAESIRLLLTVTFVILSIRGFTFSGKIINIIDAYDYPVTAYANLALNGVFSSYHSMRKVLEHKKDFYAIDEAIRETQAQYVVADEAIEDPAYPLMRKRIQKGSTNKPYNIVFILLESWSINYMDSYQQKKRFNVTPNFDKIAAEGLRFTNFYTTGQSSINALTATLTGLPTVPGIPHFGWGFEISNVMRLGHVLNRHGFETLFVQTSPRKSFRMDKITSALGFKHYYGQQDIPSQFKSEIPQHSVYGNDYDGFMFFKDKTSKLKEPFFSYFFTGSTHAPFQLAGKKFEKYPHSSQSLNGFLNTLYFSDYSLGKFFDSVKKEPWFENTIFILTADHTLTTFIDTTVQNKFQIPLVIYAPSLFEPKVVDHIGTHTDLVPTIMDLLKLDASYDAFGKNILIPDPNRGAFYVQGPSIGLITKQGYLVHNFREHVEKEAYQSGFNVDKTEKRLLSIYQTFRELHQKNRLYKSE